jgi:hypothetical protein
MGFDIFNARQINQPTAVELRFERVLLIIAVLLLAFAFPFQVLASSPFPSLLPYAVLGLAFVIRIRAEYREFSGIAIKRLTLVDLWVCLYGFLLLVHLGYNLAIGSVGLTELGSVLVNYFIPLLFYWYFRLFPNEEILRSVMIGIVIASVIIAIYSVVHAFLKMLYWPTTSTSTPNSVALFNMLEWFQHAAAEYSRLRVNEGDAFSKNLMRYYGPRSSGLLESHSVSAAWIAFGMFAALGLIGLLRRPWLGLLIGSIFLAMLLIFQYYTAIFAATISLLVIFLSLHGSLWLALTKIKPNFIFENLGDKCKKYRLISVFILLMLFGFVFAVSAHKNYLANIGVMLSIQLDLVFGSRGYVILAFGKFHEYMHYIESFPYVALVGDGMGIYYPYSFDKGSDIGVVESMARLGIPMLVPVLAAVMTLVYRMLLRKEASSQLNNQKPDGLLAFAVGIIVYVVINEVHYSIWPAKSILPILMMVCAICGMSQGEAK